MFNEADIEALANGNCVIDGVAYEAQVADSGKVEIYDLSEDVIVGVGSTLELAAEDANENPQ